MNMKNIKNRSHRHDITGADPEDLKRHGALCQPPWLADEENFRFQMV